MSLDIINILYIFITLYICVLICITSPHWFAVGPRLYKEDYLQFLNAFHFDYAAFAVSWKAWITLKGFTTPI